MKIIITERQEKLLSENRLTAFRRRLTSPYVMKDMKENIDFWIKWHDLEPYKYDSLSDFIKDVCNVMVDEVSDEFDLPRDREDRYMLYNFMVDTFSDYIKERYDKRNEDYDYYEN